MLNRNIITSFKLKYDNSYCNLYFNGNIFCLKEKIKTSIEITANLDEQYNKEMKLERSKGVLIKDLINDTKNGDNYE